MFPVRVKVIQMKMMQLIGISAAAVLSFSLVLLAPGTSAADRVTNSGEILLLSDEILGNSVEIERPAADAPPFNGVPGATPDGPTLAADGGGDDGTPFATDPDGGPTASVGDKSRSGLGDDTVPSMGSGTDNSPNEGTANPNQAYDHRGHPSP